MANGMDERWDNRVAAIAHFQNGDARLGSGAYIGRGFVGNDGVVYDRVLSSNHLTYPDGVDNEEAVSVEVVFGDNVLIAPTLTLETTIWEPHPLASGSFDGDGFDRENPDIVILGFPAGSIDRVPLSISTRRLQEGDLVETAGHGTVIDQDGVDYGYMGDLLAGGDTIEGFGSSFLFGYPDEKAYTWFIPPPYFNPDPEPYGASPGMSGSVWETFNPGTQQHEATLLAGSVLGNFEAFARTYGDDLTNPINVDWILAGLVENPLGDVNLDGNVDLLDVAPFVDRISSGSLQVEADVNEDGVVDLLDVAPFVELLAG